MQLKLGDLLTNFRNLPNEIKMFRICTPNVRCVINVHACAEVDNEHVHSSGRFFEVQFINFLLILLAPQLVHDAAE